MPDDPGVSTWTTTRLQMIDALRDRKVLASTPVLEGDEALAAIADAILACLPEAVPQPDPAKVPVESAFLRQVLTDAIRACEGDVMADGEAMQGLLAEYRAELAGLPAEGPAERAVSKPERRVAAPAAGEAPAAQNRVQPRGWDQ